MIIEWQCHAGIKFDNVEIFFHALEIREQCSLSVFSNKWRWPDDGRWEFLNNGPHFFLFHCIYTGFYNYTLDNPLLTASYSIIYLLLFNAVAITLSIAKMHCLNTVLIASVLGGMLNGITYGKYMDKHG